MLASADVNDGVEAPATAATAGPSATSEQSLATSSPDSSLPAMWDVAPSPGSQPPATPSGFSSHAAAASVKPCSGQSTQTTTTAHKDMQDTVNGAVTAVSSSAVQFDLADLLSKAATTAQRKKSKKQCSPVSKSDDAGGKLQPATQLSASPSAAAQAARKSMIGQAVDPDQEAAILEKARQLRAQRHAEEALIKATSGSSATAAAYGCAGQPTVNKKAAKQMAAQKRAERLALKHAESRAKKAAVRQPVTADAEVAAVGADQLAPVAEAADKTAAEAASIDHRAGGDAVKDTVAQLTSDVGSASADTVAAHMAPAAENDADHEPPAAKGALEDVQSSTVVAANNTSVQEAATQVAGDAVAAQEGIAEVADNVAANAAAADQTADEAAAAVKEASEVAAADSTAAEAAFGDSLTAEAAAADEPAESGQAIAQEPAGNAAADEKEADKAASQTPVGPANTVEQAAAAETAMPEPTAGQQTALRDATAGTEIRELVSTGAVAAERTANKTADGKDAVANEAASKGAVQQSADVSPAVQKTAQHAQQAAQAVQEASQAGLSQSAGRLTKAKPAPQNLPAISTGFGANKGPPQDGDEHEPDKGSISSRSVTPSCLFLQLHELL